MPEIKKDIREQYEQLSAYFIDNIPHNTELLPDNRIASMIGSCCVFESDDKTKNSILINDIFDPSKHVSVKFSNIEFNLGLALNIILLTPVGLPSDSKLESLKFFLRLFSAAYNISRKEVSDNAAIVAEFIYMLDYDNTGVPKEKLVKTITEKTKLTNNDIDNALKELEELRTIEIKERDAANGVPIPFYSIVEKVMININ